MPQQSSPSFIIESFYCFDDTYFLIVQEFLLLPTHEPNHRTVSFPFCTYCFERLE